MRITFVVLSVALACATVGCGNQDAQITPEQAKARKAADDARATHMNQYDDRLKGAPGG